MRVFVIPGLDPGVGASGPWVSSVDPDSDCLSRPNVNQGWSMSLLEEKDAIREVLAEYCFRLDGGDYDGMAALFTEDGTWDTAFGKGTGRAAIAQHARDIRARAGDNRPARDPSRDQHRHQARRRRRPRCARTGPSCRTARTGRKSARAAAMPTRWSNRTAPGGSATARSTALSPADTIAVGLTVAETAQWLSILPERSS